ncbi:MAG: hypothetical protein HYV63_11405 [Candidatus Schekmanbacteria bacterium]|nr:hypothetical protein [Candidatus Schekmanbacteria bacterium]
MAQQRARHGVPPLDAAAHVRGAVSQAQAQWSCALFGSVYYRRHTAAPGRWWQSRMGVTIPPSVSRGFVRSETCMTSMGYWDRAAGGTPSKEHIR